MFKKYSHIKIVNDRAKTVANSVIGFEIEKFRQSTGRLPTSFDELDSKRIEGLKIDRFSDKPLLFKLHSNGYSLYSIGADGKDSSFDANGIAILKNELGFVDDVVLHIKPE